MKCRYVGSFRPTYDNASRQTVKIFIHIAGTSVRKTRQYTLSHQKIWRIRQVRLTSP